MWAICVTMADIHHVRQLVSLFMGRLLHVGILAHKMMSIYLRTIGNSALCEPVSFVTVRRRLSKYSNADVRGLYATDVSVLRSKTAVK